MEQAEENEIIARCTIAALRARTVNRHEFQAVVSNTVSNLELLPPGHMVRAGLAEQLVELIMKRQLAEPADLRHMGRLTALADEAPSADPSWRRARAVARVMATMHAGSGRELTNPRGAMAELDALAEEFSGHQPIEAMIRGAQGLLGMVSSAAPTDVTVLHQSLESLRGMAPEDHNLALTLDLAERVVEGLRIYEAGDHEGAAGIFSVIQEKSADLAEGNFLRTALSDNSYIEMLSARSRLIDGLDADPVSLDRFYSVLRDFGHHSDATDAEHRFADVGQSGFAILADNDIERINAGIDNMWTAVRQTSTDHPDVVFYQTTLATGLYRRSELTGSSDDANEAIGLLEQARDSAQGPYNAHWSFLNEVLADVLRRRGYTRQSRRAALEGLRGYTWRVLLQPDPASARTIARDAAQMAMATASRCLNDNAVTDALRALDAGRGLLLFAATELRDPGTRLIDAGQTELAERWGATQQPSIRLREQVVEALSSNTGLLDPPDLGEIQDALRRLDMDALVYLVPANTPAPGWAVIAPAEGPALYLALPYLVTEEATDLERYLATLTSRNGHLVDSLNEREIGVSQSTQFADSLDPLCRWAWKAAMGPLIKLYPNPGPDSEQDRVPRLALIPMGDLARVPWQAARDPEGEYLVHKVAISQTASARMLCNVAAAEQVPPTATGLILADPDTDERAVDLLSARIEAYAIRQTFYPGATFVGRRPDGKVSRSGAGTADDVRAWLRAEDTQAGAMLHLASHGIIETARATASSRLILAGGDLSADELLGIMTETTHHPIGLVVLAACHTGQSIHGYDEAYSLGTMFLAGGVRSVLSTQWSIPDGETSLLMYMFHHFLTVEGRPPRDALRRAQMWMLDGDRSVPEHMPGPLRRMLRSTDPTRVVAWAGFVHWGQ